MPLFRISIETKPTLSLTLKDVKIEEESNQAVFECETDKETQDVVWLRNGKELEEDDSKFLVKSTGRHHSLTVKDIALEDTGKFSCKIGEIETVAELFVEGITRLWWPARVCA